MGGANSVKHIIESFLDWINRKSHGGDRMKELLQGELAGQLKYDVKLEDGRLKASLDEDLGKVLDLIVAQAPSNQVVIFLVGLLRAALLSA
jgi:hypothetical protein